jgi:hypothetical protein
VVLDCGFPLLGFFGWQISVKGCYRINVIKVVALISQYLAA